MRIGFNIVMYILLLNLVCGLMYALAVPGTEFSNVLYGTGDTEDYQERFNATEFMDRTEPEASDAFTFVGHIWGGLQLIWNGIRFTVFGFPTMLQGIGDQIGDSTAKLAFDSISGILIAGTSFIIFMWLYQLLTGRRVED